MAKRTATVSTVCPPGRAAGDTLQIEHDGTAYHVPVTLPLTVALARP